MGKRKERRREATTTSKPSSLRFLVLGQGSKEELNERISYVHFLGRSGHDMLFRRRRSMYLSKSSPTRPLLLLLLLRSYSTTIFQTFPPPPLPNPEELPEQPKRTIPLRTRLSTKAEVLRRTRRIRSRREGESESEQSLPFRYRSLHSVDVGHLEVGKIADREL